METADLFIGTAHVFAGATFARIPAVGEYVSFQNQWHQVTEVGHTWKTGTNVPFVNITLSQTHSVAAGGPVGPFPAGPGPFTA
jgi:hypothetical protein